MVFLRLGLLSIVLYSAVQGLRLHDQVKQFAITPTHISVKNQDVDLCPRQRPPKIDARTME